MEIARNSHLFRPLGLGYANLGALLMSNGIPYDSDEASDVIALLTAIMTGTAYKTSAQLASLKGPFDEYAKNMNSMHRVIDQHHASLNIVKDKNHPLFKCADDVWTEAKILGQKFGFRILSQQFLLQLELLACLWIVIQLALSLTLHL